MFKDLDQFKENLRTLINHETTKVEHLTPKSIIDLEHEIERDISNFVDSLIKSSRLINALDYMNQNTSLNTMEVFF